MSLPLIGLIPVLRDLRCKKHIVDLRPAHYDAVRGGYVMVKVRSLLRELQVYPRQQVTLNYDISSVFCRPSFAPKDTHISRGALRTSTFKMCSSSRVSKSRARVLCSMYQSTGPGVPVTRSIFWFSSTSVSISPRVAE